MKRLLPLARDWAKEQEEFILRLGTPLSARQIADAERVGVQDPSRVRLLPVDRVPPPGDSDLAAAARQAQIITDASLAVTVGHGILMRADRWQDRELMLHQLVHVAQFERCGSLEVFVEQYLNDRTAAPFSVGKFEEEARRVAREICAADSSDR
jgi:hypothetical protein